MYVVDGNNLLHQMSGLPGDFDRARERLVELLAELARRESQDVRLYFDGTGGLLRATDLARPRLRVFFAGAERESADRAILEYVEQADEPRKLKVVSSDSDVAKACRLSGAKVVSSQAVARKLEDFDSKQAAPPRSEKPQRGAVGDLERKMLEEVGDFGDFTRDIEDGLPD